jgi:hypothetical protein
MHFTIKHHLNHRKVEIHFGTSHARATQNETERQSAKFPRQIQISQFYQLSMDLTFTAIHMPQIENNL